MTTAAIATNVVRRCSTATVAVVSEWDAVAPIVVA